MAGDIFEELTSEHDEMRRMASELEQAYDRKAFEEFTAYATSHMKAEEKVLYKEIQDAEETHDSALEGLEEHHFIEMALRELKEVDPRADRWMAKLTVLSEMNEHHMMDEEEEMFPAARQVVGSRSAELAERYEKEHESMMARA